MAEPGASEPPTARVLEVLEEHGIRPLELIPLAGDVSLRSYFRLRLEEDRTAILATYPPDLRDSCERFARTSSLLAGAGVRVPEIRLSRCQQGLMVVEDLGERTLYDLREQSWDALLPYLREAVEIIDAIRAIPTAAVRGACPPLDHELLTAELARTWELLSDDPAIAFGSLPPSLEAAFDEMLERLSASPRASCHRDFMARNLVPVGDAPRLAVIDHQDLRIGPATYDLASLLNDSLYPPHEIEAQLVAASLQPTDTPLDYHRAASQRTLKAIGTFVAFARRGDERHRVLIRPTLERARHHLLKLPEMESVEGEIEALWQAVTAPGPVR